MSLWVFKSRRFLFGFFVCFLKGKSADVRIFTLQNMWLCAEKCGVLHFYVHKNVVVLHKYVHKSVMISSPERTIWHRQGCKPL